MSSLWKRMRMSDLELLREWCHTADHRHYGDAKITQAVTRLIVMSLFHEKWMCANAQRSLQAVCVCVCHTLMLYQGSSLLLITQDSSEPRGEGQVNAWTHTHTKNRNTHQLEEPIRHTENVLCLIWFAPKVNYLRELIDFMSTKVQYAKAVWVISTGVHKKKKTT